MLQYLASVSNVLHSLVSVFKMLSVLCMAVNTGPVMDSVILQAVLCSSALCFSSTGIMKVDLNIVIDLPVSYPRIRKSGRDF